jgi:hypothetical protein
MKLCAIGLIVCCSHVCAQSFVNNPVAAAAAAQNVANTVAIDQSIAVVSRTDNTACIPMILVGDPQVVYIAPREGHEPSWHPEKYNSAPPFQANTLPPSTVERNQSRTDSMKAQPWENSNAATMKIASTSSNSSSSSYVSQWSSNGKTTTESSAETEVTVNGKIYRTFQHDIQTTPSPTPQEPQSYNERIILCR